MGKLYRVFWRSRLTGETGCGEPISAEAAAAAAQDANREWPDFHHWIEPA